MEYYTIFFTLVFAILAFLWRTHRSRPSPPLPPGPPALPILGNLPSLSPQLHVHFTKLVATYGPIFRIWFGHKLCVVISSPGLAKEALRDENEMAMANHDVSAAVRVIDYGGNVLFTPMGPEWTMLRGIMVRRLMNPVTLDELYGVRRREVRKSVAHLREFSGREVDFGDLVFVTIVNSMLSMVGAGSLEMEVGREVRELVGEFTKLFGTPNVSDFFPVLARFDLMGLQRKMEGLVGRMDRFLDSIIDRKRREIEMEGSKEDFLEMILDLEKKGGESETPFTMRHLKGLLLV